MRRGQLWIANWVTFLENTALVRHANRQCLSLRLLCWALWYTRLLHVTFLLYCNTWKYRFALPSVRVEWIDAV